jgi:hypothetical protein
MTREPSLHYSRVLPYTLVTKRQRFPCAPSPNFGHKMDHFPAWIYSRQPRSELPAQRAGQQRRALLLFSTQPHQQRIQMRSQNTKPNLNPDFVQPEF